MTQSTTTSCLTCAAPVTRSASARRRGRGLYCSYPCRDLGTSRRPRLSFKVPCICEWCSAPFMVAPSNLKRTGRGRFCSLSCAARSRGAAIRATLPARFWANVDKTGPSHPYRPELGTCWTWTASTHAGGYGCIGVAGQVRLTHRIAWEMASGETLTRNDVVCHTCDAPACNRNDSQGTWTVNGVEYPRRGHLFKATHGINVADKIEKGRWRVV